MYPYRFLRFMGALLFLSVLLVPVRATASPQSELYLYHHYADFTPAQCTLLPAAYVRACVAGARVQKASPYHDTLAQRVRLFALYRQGRGFSFLGCTLLPTDSVELCQAKFRPHVTAPIVPTVPAAGVPVNVPAVNAPAPPVVTPTVTAPAPVCFSFDNKTTHCGTTYPLQKDILPATLAASAAACDSGWLYSPWGCPLAEGREPVGVSRGDAPAAHYFAWLATGDLFSCPAGQAPTAGAGCIFFYRTIGGWGMAHTFPASELHAAATCPVPLQGTETGAGRIAVTIGLGTYGGAWKAEPAIVDTGAPDTYVEASQLAGTSWKPSGLLTRMLFPLWGNTSVPDQPYTGQLAVLDGSTWVSLGTVTVQGVTAPTGDGLGMDALRGSSLAVSGGAWTLSLHC